MVDFGRSQNVRDLGLQHPLVLLCVHEPNHRQTSRGRDGNCWRSAHSWGYVRIFQWANYFQTGVQAFDKENQHVQRSGPNYVPNQYSK